MKVDLCAGRVVEASVEVEENEFNLPPKVILWGDRCFVTTYHSIDGVYYYSEAKFQKIEKENNEQ